MNKASSSNTTTNPSFAGRSGEWAPATSSTPPTTAEPARVVYRYEYTDPYAPMSTRKQVLLGVATSLVVIAFIVAALVIGQQ